MIGNRKNTKELLELYQKKAKKSFGQNFLVDENILYKIISNADLDQTVGVIEIGPGLGALTEQLALYAKKVLAYEIDKVMIEILQDTLAQYNNVYIINQDILKADILKDLKTYLNDCQRIVVIANIPYYITTPIIFKFLELDYPFEYLILMVQKELAERLTGKPKTKDYNALSVLMDYKTNSKILFNVSKNCFYPAPKVDSAVIKIIPTNKGYVVQNEKEFFKFIRNIFSSRRKILVNNISSCYHINKDEVKNILMGHKYQENIRPEELSTGEIIEIFHLLVNNLNR